MYAPTEEKMNGLFRHYAGRKARKRRGRGAPPDGAWLEGPSFANNGSGPAVRNGSGGPRPNWRDTARSTPGIARAIPLTPRN